MACSKQMAMASTAEAGDDGGECSGSNWNTSVLVTMMGLICVEEVARSSAERHGGDAPSSAEMECKGDGPSAA